MKLDTSPTHTSVNGIFSIKYLPTHYKLGIVDLKYKVFFFNYLSSQDISLHPAVLSQIQTREVYKKKKKGINYMCLETVHSLKR